MEDSIKKLTDNIDNNCKELNKIVNRQNVLCEQYI